MFLKATAIILTLVILGTILDELVYHYKLEKERDELFKKKRYNSNED